MAVRSRPIGPSRRDDWLAALTAALAHRWAAALAYLLLLVLGYALLTPAFTWGQRRLDDARYGFPRSTHVTTEAGADGAPTYLTALNLNGQVSILELPGGDATRVRHIAAPYLVGADGPYIVPHLELRDLTGDGREELLLRLRGEVVVYVHDGDGFRLMTPAERGSLSASGAGR